MMTRNKLFFFFILFPNLELFSQNIFSVKYKSQSDFTAYVVNYKSQADLLVFKVEYKSQAKGNDGLWYFVDYESQSDKKIFFEKYKSQADINIFFVEYKSQVGWRNKNKIHLLY